MKTDRLTPLQRDLVRALAQRESGFFLTGGGVLVGFVLGHRTTDDLDLFTTDDAAMAEACKSKNCFPGFTDVTYSRAATTARA